MSAGGQEANNLDVVYLRLLARAQKNDMPEKKKQDTDKFVEDWIKETGKKREDFDHYAQTDPDLHSLWKDFVKYDKSQPVLDEDAYKQATSFLFRAFYSACRDTGEWSDEQIFSLSSWDNNTSPGYPWNLCMNNTGEFRERMGHHLKNMFEDFKKGQSMHPIWNVSPKFEIRKRSKLKERKIRSFTAAPKHFTYVVQRLCSDFNQKFYNANSRTWSRVGMSMFRGGWNVMLQQLLRFHLGFEYDATQFDSSLFKRLLRTICDFRKACLAEGNQWMAELLDRVYDEIISSVCILPGGFVFMKDGGNPSGSPNTVVDNTLCLFLLFAYICIVAFKKAGKELTFELFMTEIVAAMYGDDNTFTMTPAMATVITPEAVAEISTEIGITLRNEYPDIREAYDLKFLNMRSRLVDGWYMPVPDTDKMRGSILHNPSDHCERYLRLSGLKIVCYWNEEVRSEINDLLNRTGQALNSYADNYVNPKTGMTIAQIRSANLTRSQLRSLWFGEESVIDGKTDRYNDVLNMSLALAFESRVCEDGLVVPAGTDWTKGFRFGEASNPGPKWSTVNFDGGRKIETRVYRPLTSYERFQVWKCQRRGKSVPFIINIDGVAYVEPTDWDLFDPTLGYPGEGPWTDAFNKMQFRYHGNWAGPNYGGGKMLNEGEQPDWRVEPIDELDALARRHDFNTSTRGINYADNLLLQEMESLPGDVRHKFKSDLMELGFRWKLGRNRRRVQDHGDYPWDRIPQPSGWDDDEHDWKSGARIGEATNPGPKRGGGRGKGHKSAERKMMQVVKKVRRQQKKIINKAVKKRPGKVVKVQARAKVPKYMGPGVFAKGGVKRVKIKQNIGTQRITGRVFAFFVSNTGSGTVFFSLWNNPATGGTDFLFLNPYSLGQFTNQTASETPIVAACDFKKKWSGTIKVIYEDACPQSTTGAYVGFVDRDSADDETVAVGSQQIMNVAAQHAGAKSKVDIVPYYNSRSWTFKTSKPLWLRQAPDADIRGTALGKFYLINAAPSSDSSVKGAVYIEYDINLFMNSSNERFYVMEATATANANGGTNAVVFPYSLPSVGWLNPKSEVCQPCTAAPPEYTVALPNPQLVWPSGTVSSSNGCGFNPCVTETAPVTQYAEVQVSVIGNVEETTVFNSENGLHVYLAGMDVTDTLFSHSYIASKSGNMLMTGALRVPSGTKPNEMQVIPYFTCSGTTPASTTVTCSVTPSTYFPSDWNLSSLPSKEVHVSKVKRGATMSNEDSLDVDGILSEYKETESEDLDYKEADHEFSRAVANALRRHLEDEKRSQHEKTDSCQVEMVRPRERASRIGEAKNPGPVTFNADKFRDWLKKARTQDITVRANRAELSEAADKMEEKGGFPVSNTTYQKVFMFLRSSRNPLSNDAKLAFEISLMKLADEFDEYLERNAPAGQEQGGQQV